MSHNPNEPYIDPNTIQGREVTSKEQAYRDGYVNGRDVENRAQANLHIQREADARARANNSAASGLLLGILIALIAAAIGGIAFYLSRDTTAPETQAPTESNTVIEVPEIEVPEVEVPDINVTAPDVNVTAPEVPAPDINITAPEAPAPTEPTGATSSEPVEAAPTELAEPAPETTN